MGLREIKATARRNLHNAMQVPAFYIEDPEIIPLPDPLPCTVRVHTAQTALGELAGTSFDYAEKHEVIPRLVFLFEEVPEPTRNSIVTILDPATLLKEAYKVDNRHPRDGITVTADVILLTPEEYATLPFREA